MKSNNKNKKMLQCVKRIAAIALAVIVGFGTLSVDWGSGANKTYAAHWADAYLNNLVQQNIMKGNQFGELNPDIAITRAEFVAMMNRAFGYTAKGSTKFKDVDENAWYADDISIAAKQGYFQGSNKNRAEPDRALKREEAVTMLCRALKIEGVDEDVAPFIDSRNFSNWSKEYINAAINKNYVNGYPDNTFRPADSMTRGEMAKVLSEVAGDIVREAGTNTVGHTSGNVSVVKSGSNLNNTVISGDLYITAGTGLGSTTLQDVVVQGDLIVSGTGESENGENSIILDNCTINRLIVDSVEGKPISIRAENHTDIDQTVVKCNAYLEEASRSKNSAFRDVNLNGPSGTTLTLSGDFEDVKILGEGNKLALEKGFIDRLTVDEEAVGASISLTKDTGVGDMFLDTGTKVTGEGTIDSVIINANGTTIDMMPDEIIIRPGVTATVGGQKMGYQDAEINSRSPEFEDGYPELYEVEPTSADILVSTNKPGKVYWIVREAGTGSSFSKEELKEPKKDTYLKNGSLGVMTETETHVKVSGLQAGIEYEFIAVFTDLQDKNSSIEKERFTTIDNIAPTFLSGYPKVKNSDTTQLTMSAILSKDCDIYWVALPTKSVAPTIDMVVKQEVSGSVSKGVVTGAQLNVEKDFPISGLTEFVTYDVYMVAQDDSENRSRLVKTTVTTADKTPPHFTYGPKKGTAGVTNVQVLFTADEDGTIYWVAVKKGEQFPKPTTPSKPVTTESAITTEQAITDAIITGNDVQKKGKTTMKADVQTSFNASGLEKETDYDIYMVLQDKAGNTSAVEKLSVKPTDVTPPTATLEFEDTIDGRPLANSTVTMKFNEIVCDSISGETLYDLVKTSPEALKNNIKLWDMSQYSPEELSISFSAIMVKEEDGKTLIEFNSPRDVTLASGNTYQFELNNLQDTSGNKIEKRTKLPLFSTVPPLVNFENDSPDKGNHVAFVIKPQEKNTTPNIYYDTVLSSNEDIVFTLYTTDTSGNTTSVPGLRLDKGRAYTLRYLLDKNDVLGEYHFTPFNQLEETKYQIQMTELNGNSSVNSWDAKVTITAKGIIGDYSNMQNAVNALAGGGLDRLKEFTDEGSIFTVEYPADFSRTVIFSDTEIPQFEDGYPDFVPGETKIAVNVITDKPATMYYVAAKKDRNGNPATATPSAYMMEVGMNSGSDLVSGKMEIEYGSTLTKDLIENLDPTPAAYRIYYMLKGTMPEGSKIASQDIEMTDIADPYWQAYPVYNPGAKSVNVQFTVNTEAEVYWVVYQKDALFEGGSSTPSAMEVIEPKDDSTRKLIGHGSLNVIGGERAEVVCDGLELDKQYKFFAVAKKELGDGTSEVAGIPHMVPLDDEPPYIMSIDPYITKHTTNGGFDVYNGSVSIIFSEPMFYSNTASGKPEPLTVNALCNGAAKPTSPDGTTITIDQNSITTVTIIDERGNSVEAVKSFDIKFTKFKKNAYVKFPWLGDARNLNAQLILTMKIDPEDPLQVIFDHNW